MNWSSFLNWVPALLNVIAYAAGQVIGHRQGSSIAPPKASQVADTAAKVVDVLRDSSNDAAIDAAAARAGTAAGAAAERESHLAGHLAGQPAEATPKLPLPKAGPHA